MFLQPTSSMSQGAHGITDFSGLGLLRYLSDLYTVTQRRAELVDRRQEMIHV